MAVFRRDPCGIMVVLMAYICLIYADYVVIAWLILRHLSDSLWGTIHAVCFNFCIFMAFFAHTRCMLTDPGIIPRPENVHDRVSSQAALSADSPVPLNSNLQVEETENRGAYSGVYLGVYARPIAHQGPDATVCPRCDMYRPPRAHHCRTCEGCVRKMDHHCPWINNCVGAYNQKYFVQFLVWVGVASAYAGAIALYSGLADCAECQNEPSPTQQSALMHTIVLAAECCLFGGFVIVMIFDQMLAIMKDETGIESLKRAGSFRKHASRRALLREACGTGTPFCWIFPCQSLNQPIEESTIITTLV